MALAGALHKDGLLEHSRHIPADFLFSLPYLSKLNYCVFNTVLFFAVFLKEQSNAEFK